VVDAAASFDTIDAGAICAGALPVAVSLHATKTFSTAKGGLILGGDGDFVQRAIRALNFGFYHSRSSTGPSINGKLSEYHAAIGLAELDGWREKRNGFRASARHYAAAAAAHGLESRFVADVEKANPYALFLAEDRTQAAAIIEALRRERVETRFWYDHGLHRQPAFADCAAERLAATDDIAPRLIGLPFAVDLLPDVINHIMATIAAALASTPRE
jgi:dTDP-4-amino-4,6-dideoxygalactose transaminase